MARSRISLTHDPVVVVSVVVAALALAGWSPAMLPPSAAEQEFDQEPDEPLRVDAPPCFSTVTASIPSTGGRVLEARDPERMTVGSDDIVDVDPGGMALRPGDRLEIFRPLGPVERPGGGELGEGVLVLGELHVADVSQGLVVGRVGETCAEVQVGDRLRPGVEDDALAAVPMPEFRPDRVVAPRPGDATVVFGHVETVPDAAGEIGTRWAQMTYATGDVVTIDQGAADGWSTGATALLYQHGRLPGDPPAYERDSVVPLAMGVAISVRPDTTSLLITGGDRAVRIGVRARRTEGG